MLLGTIQGKITTGEFTFEAKEEPKNYEYVKVYHKVYDYVLCQIIEVTKNTGKTSAFCQVIGYRDGDRIKRPRIPFDPETEVLRADDEFISSIINLESDEQSAIIGQLDGRTIPVPIDLNKILTKHVAILAKSGAGKSYTVGVLLEEIIERGVPVIVIDPHGEYGGLSRPTEDDAEELSKFGVDAKGFSVSEYADRTINPQAKPMQLTTRLTSAELMHLLPGKLSANQQAILYSALKNMKEVNFDNLLYELEAEESPAKFSIISTIEYLRSLPIFTPPPTPYSELVRPGHAAIINLRGISPDVHEIIVYKLWKKVSPYEHSAHWLARFWKIFNTFLFITFTRIWFRSESMEQANQLIHQITREFNARIIPEIIWSYKLVFGVMILGYLTHWVNQGWKLKWINRFIATPIGAKVVITIVVIFIIYQSWSADLQPFIYFQF